MNLGAIRQIVAVGKSVCNLEKNIEYHKTAGNLFEAAAVECLY